MMSLIHRHGHERARGPYRKLIVLVLALLASTVLTPAASASPTARDGSTEADYWNWINANSGKCLGVAGGDMTNGTPVVQWDCNGNPDQFWSVVGLNDGAYYQFRNFADPEKCLAVPGQSRTPGVQLVIWDCLGQDDQFWRADNLDGNCLVLLNYNSDLIIGVAGGSVNDGAQVVQWPWQGHPDQHWC